MRIMETESSFNPDAESPAGAEGLMQLMPDTAEMWGVEDRKNPVQNIYGGVAQLDHLLDITDGNIGHALAANNWGYGKGKGEKVARIVKIRNGIMPKETQLYVKKVNYAKGMQ